MHVNEVLPVTSPATVGEVAPVHLRKTGSRERRKDGDGPGIPGGERTERGGKGRNLRRVAGNGGGT